MSPELKQAWARSKRLYTDVERSMYIIYQDTCAGKGYRVMYQGVTKRFSNRKVPMAQRLDQAEAFLANLEEVHASGGDVKKFSKETRATAKEAADGLPENYTWRSVQNIRYRKQVKGKIHREFFHGPDAKEAAWRHHHKLQAASKTTDCDMTCLTSASSRVHTPMLITPHNVICVHALAGTSMMQLCVAVYYLLLV